MGSTLLDYAEKDLGVVMNRTFNVTEHSTLIFNKANQRFRLLKRTCHFVHNKNRKRVIYLAIVSRSLFVHCPTVWRPSSNTVIGSLEKYKNGL